MKVIQSNRFKKAYKKLHRNQLVDINLAIEAIIADPNIGERKEGDLSWLWVYKFKMVKQLTLIGYNVEENDNITLNFIDFGSHENFYRDLKR